MNSVFDQSNLEPPSPVPSRPPSRASSFIEDVKQFLAPLSRKSSRNSMYQDYQATTPVLEKKSSHQSLFDVINLCKPKSKQAPSYEQRVIQMEDNGSHWGQDEFEFGAQTENTIVPLRRKQIKKIESRTDRMNIYSKYIYFTNIVYLFNNKFEK